MNATPMTCNEAQDFQDRIAELIEKHGLDDVQAAFDAALESIEEDEER